VTSKKFDIPLVHSQNDKAINELRDNKRELYSMVEKQQSALTYMEKELDLLAKQSASKQELEYLEMKLQTPQSNPEENAQEELIQDVSANKELLDQLKHEVHASTGELLDLANKVNLLEKRNS